MKTFLKSIFYFSLAALVLIGCAKNDDFTIPNTGNCEEPSGIAAVNISLVDIHGKATETLAEYTDDDVFEGVVISSDQGGNFYRDLFVVSRDGSISARIKLNKGATYASYPIGRIIKVKMKGLYYQIDNTVLTIGATESGNKFTTPINDISKHIFRSCTTISEPAFSKEYVATVSLAQSLEPQYLGKLVKIENVQFGKEVLGKPFWDKDNLVSSTNKATNNPIIGKENNVTANVIFRVVEQSSDFATKIIPNNSGSMIGIMTKFRDDYQFVPRIWKDIQLTQPLFDTEGPIDPEIEVKPGKFLAFPGADFEDWNAFQAVLTSHGTNNIAQAPGIGWENSNGLAVNGTADKNIYLFTVQNIKVPDDATKISFLLKGKSAKSIIPLVYQEDGTKFIAYNVGNVSTSKEVKASTELTDGNSAIDYGGTIDTKGEWVKISIDLSSFPEGLKYNTTGQGSFLGFKIGKDAVYDLVLDEIRFEDGTPVEIDPTPGEQEMLADFNDWTGFLASLNSFGLKYGTPAIGEGRNGKDAMKLVSVATGNDYLFTIENKAISKGKTKLVVWIKGTSDTKSLSFNVYKEEGFNAFNTDAVTGNMKISMAANNQYGGAIDTKGQWVKLELDLSTMDGDYNSTGTGSVFAAKVGKGANYDLLIDSIYFE